MTEGTPSGPAATTFSKQTFVDELQSICNDGQAPSTTDRTIAAVLDSKDDLHTLRQQYSLPLVRDVCKGAATAAGDQDGVALYMCGNSLGPQARLSRRYVEQELQAWARKAVLGHFDHPYGRPWTQCEERLAHLMSDIVGAKPSEVVAMGTLTANLHVMLATFYRPHADQLIASAGKDASTTETSQPRVARHKIIYEALAFPSDKYALASAVALAGYDPQTSLIALQGHENERTLRTEDILAVLEREAATGELGLLLLGDVQYQTGQMFDFARITKRARELGIIVGWDLAHAFANVPLALHDWDVDFAVWCTYKYGSSGPGGMAGAFVHERWGDVGFQTTIGRDAKAAAEAGTGAVAAKGLPRPAGWWGHKKGTRFSMPDSFDSISGAAGWQQSNPSSLDTASLLGALETLAMAPGLADESKREFDVGSDEHVSHVNALDTPLGYGHIMPVLRQKSQRLTAYLEHLLLSDGFLPKRANVHIITPDDPEFRGSMLSVCVPTSLEEDSSAPTTVVSAPHSETPSSAPAKPSNVPPPIATTSFTARVHKRMETEFGVVCDIRHPDIIRIAPLAQYNTFEEVWQTANAFRLAIEKEIQ